MLRLILFYVLAITVMLMRPVEPVAEGWRPRAVLRRAFARSYPLCRGRDEPVVISAAVRARIRILHTARMLCRWRGPATPRSLAVVSATACRSAPSNSQRRCAGDSCSHLRPANASSAYGTACRNVLH